MAEGYVSRTFKSGNSVALRLPKGLGVPEGTEVRMVKEAGMTFRVEAVDAPKRKIDLTGIWGACPDLEPLKREDFDDPPRPWHLLGRPDVE